MTDARLYSAEDAQQILQLAIARDTESGELSRHQLLEIAEELGIAPQTLLAAEQEWQLQRYQLADQRLFDQQRRDRFHHDLTRFGVTGGFIAGINSLLLHWHWLWWPAGLLLLPWALRLILRGLNIYRPNQYAYAKEFERWRRKRQVERTVKGVFTWLGRRYSR